MNYNHDVIITGDFNEDQFKRTNNKIKGLLDEFNLFQIISEPAHFTESSSSLIDLFIVSNPSIIEHCFVGDSFIENVIRYQCAITALLKLKIPMVRTSHRNICLYNNGNYYFYRSELNKVCWSNLILNNDIDTSVINVTKTIMNIAEKSIPNIPFA